MLRIAWINFTRERLWAISLLIFLIANSPLTHAQSKNMLQFLNWEAEHNIGAKSQGVNFKQKELSFRYLEISLDEGDMYQVDDYRKWMFGADQGPHGLTIDFAEYLPEDIKKFFVFNKDGKKFLKWPIHPLDKNFYKKLMSYLEERKVPYKLVPANKSDLRGYRTSSKSSIITIPGSEHSFSFKTGTNSVGQNEGFARPNPSRWAHFNRKLSDYFYTQKDKLKTLDVAWEAGAIMFPPLTPGTDNAINIRLMENVSAGEKYQLTGFVLHDKKEIERICKINGMTPEAFKKQISHSFGSFLAEMNLVLGFRVMSAHLQNVRFELDKNLKPTGKVIMLDLTDGGPVAAIFKANGQDQLLDDWRSMVSETSVGKDYFPNRIIDVPDWKQSQLDPSDKSSWFRPMDIDEMHKGFEERASELGDFSGKIIYRKNGDVDFKFKDADDLMSRFNVHGSSCAEIIKGLTH